MIAPGTGGQLFTSFRFPNISRDNILFLAGFENAGSSYGNGIFLSRHGKLFKVLLENEMLDGKIMGEVRLTSPYSLVGNFFV
jgi:hypothetical protein